MLDQGMMSKVEVFLACTNLPRMDLLSQSDPFAIFEMKLPNGQWINLGQTETIQNNPSPIFQKQFLIDYKFEELQPIRIRVNDDDTKGLALASFEPIGQAELLLANLITARNGTLSVPLLQPNGTVCRNSSGIVSMLVLRSEEVIELRQIAEITLHGSELDKKDFFGKSDPYLEFYRIKEDGSQIRVHTTEVCKNSLNPAWKPFALSLQLLCNGDIQRPIRFVCLDWNRRSKPDYIGEATASIAQMMSSPGYSFPVIDSKKASSKKYQNSGHIVVSAFAIKTIDSFMDYIRGGCQLNLLVAIDFTGSNGDPRDHESLHFIHGSHYNQYQVAIRTIGDILAPYDSDQQFPVWGFGAKLHGNIRHCFPLTMSEEMPEVRGVQGILDVYSYAISSVTLSGPTIFAEVIRKASTLAAASHPSNQQYMILLILTDGVINDMMQTIDCLVQGSSLPLSVIIVGVGSADFSLMHQLDGDDGLLKSGSGVQAVRDIVQFVPFNKFAKFPATLAQETLEEVPRQLMQYMKIHKLKPQPLPK